MDNKKIFKSAKIKNSEDQFTFNAKLVGYDNQDRENDIIKSGAFKESIKNKAKYPLLYNHMNDDLSDTIGYFEAIEKNDGVYIKAKINEKEEKALKVYDYIKKGVLTEMSVGFIPTDYEFNSSHDGFDIHSALMYEGSVVQVPANENAKIIEVKKLEKEQKEKQMNFEKDIKDSLDELKNKINDLSADDKAKVGQAVEEHTEELSKYKDQIAQIIEEAKKKVLETMDSSDSSSTSDNSTSSDSSRTDSSNSDDTKKEGE